MPTFYQKYRPNNFEEIVNQNHIKITLQNEIETSEIAHAYLFTGPRGTGKTTMARVFAKALNCGRRAEGKSEPCNKCASCEQIKKGVSLDIVEIDAASHTGVENVRENIIASARVGVSPNKWRIFIIDEVHMLTMPAFNALLKTLEEPPKNVIFILATTEVHKLPATIISRCQRFDFKRIAVSDIMQKLRYIADKESIEVEKSILETIARESEGHMRDAESLLGQVYSISGNKITAAKADLIIPHSNLRFVIDLIKLIFKKDSAGAIRLVNQLVDEGVDLKQFTADLIETLRRMMLIKVDPNLAEKFAQDISQSLEEEIRPLLQQTNIEKFSKIINIFSQARENLKTAFIAQLPLEMAIIEILSVKPVPDTLQMPASQAAAAPAPAGAAVPAGNIKPDEVKKRWREVLVKIKKYNHSLSFILKICEPRDQNGQVCLTFKYKFHQDRVEQVHTRPFIDKALVEVFGAPVPFVTALDEGLDVNNEAASVLADDGNVKDKQIKEEATSNQQSATSDKLEKEDGQKEDEKKPNAAGVENILKMFGGKVIQ